MLTLMLGFYLNYVGCKGSLGLEAALLYSGFTLTMWDVKDVESYS